MPGYQNTGPHLPAPMVIMKTLHAELSTPCIHISTISKCYKNPGVYHKSSHYYPSSLCLVSVPGHLQEDEKNTRAQLIFPGLVSRGAADVSAAQCHRTGWLGLKLAEPWRAEGNLLTRLARELSTAQRGTLIRSQVGPFNKPIRASQKPARLEEPGGSMGRLT